MEGEERGRERREGGREGGREGVTKGGRGSKGYIFPSYKEKCGWQVVYTQNRHSTQCR